MIDNDAQEVINEQAKGVFPPMMEWRRFAEWIGVDEGIVYNWMRRAYLPTVKVGKYPMVNVVVLVERLREGEL
jgi:hypothetical protein